MALPSGFHREYEFHLDSGATGHFCNSKHLLTEMNRCQKLGNTIANGDKLVTDLYGNLNLPVKINNHVNDVNFNKVYHVMNINTNLLSVGGMVKKGNTVEFNKNGAKICNKNKKFIATATLEGSLFKFDLH
ncbi:hypothetical protein WA026_023819 [Henosepilachna vigintioctopunctata]|uniref:Retrovirus-related Pol polyprotein from transposon TNT 1-94-like beta-barrel domain-containing protein n=1 Tax=Henosepilachna vigintioctopunctata TaxID=420089 RepID=A0AAW1USI8_9CUCU